MTLSLVNFRLLDAPSKATYGSYVFEPYWEGFRHLFQAFAWKNPAYPTLKQRVFHLIAGAGLIFPFANYVVYFTLRYFNQRSTQLNIPPRPGVTSQIRPPTGNIERIQYAANLARDSVRQNILSTTLQTEIHKFITRAETNATNLLREQGREGALVVVENAEKEFAAIVLQLKEISLLAVAVIEGRMKQVTDGNLAWHTTIVSILLRRGSIEEFNSCLREGDTNGFLRGQFTEFMGGTLFHHLTRTDRYLEYIPCFRGLSFDPAIQDLWGNTCLVWAIANAANGSARAILQLFNRGPYLDVQCLLHANTALHLAVGKGYHDRSQDGAILACSNLELVKQMIALGANLNLQNQDGNTPLHLAFLRRNKEMVAALIQGGADQTLRNQQGYTPRDLLRATYPQACQILQETVAVFTLDPEEFHKNTGLYTDRASNADF